MKIIVIGGGVFGTALANEIACNNMHCVTLLTRDRQVVQDISRENINFKYFPNHKLNTNLKASEDWSLISTADILIVAIPTRSIPQIIKLLKKYIKKEALIINVAKGIFENGTTIVDFLKTELNHQNIVTLKGASFGAEIINGIPTLMTLGFEKKEQLNLTSQVFKNSSVFLDYTTDIRGVEILSALKNIYAILLGYIDARYNAANTRFLFLTKSFEEIKLLLRTLDGKIETMSLSCGIGDISLTGLNDLSRNRTLGLLIGKGFYNISMDENSVVLEGLKTLKYINESVHPDTLEKLPLLRALYSLLINKETNALNVDFEELFKRKYKTVLTYGTFDLLHYGHLEILRRAKSLGDRLIVGLSTDEFNEGKGKKCIIKYEKRKQLLESLPYVDLVIPEKTWEQKIDDVQKHHIDVFVMGSDWEGKFDYLEQYCEVRYFPRTKGISTSKLKEILKK